MAYTINIVSQRVIMNHWQTKSVSRENQIARAQIGGPFITCHDVWQKFRKGTCHYVRVSSELHFLNLVSRLCAPIQIFHWNALDEQLTECQQVPSWVWLTHRGHVGNISQRLNTVQKFSTRPTADIAGIISCKLIENFLPTHTLTGVKGWIPSNVSVSVFRYLFTGLNIKFNWFHLKILTIYLECMTRTSNEAIEW